jgi:RimJ/RimL family protein N-acetyltransferase
MHQIEPPQYQKVRGLFTPLRYNLVVDSVLDGNTPAWVFADDGASPRVSLMWDRQDAMLLAGSSYDPEPGPDLAALLGERIIPDARARGIPALSLHFAPDEWVQPLATTLAPWHATTARRRFYHCPPSKVIGWQPRVPAGCSVRRIDAELLCGNRENADQVAGWVRSFWHSDEDFLRLGFGYCLLVGDVVASWCLTVFASGQEREMGVATVQSYRRRGLAAIVASATLEHCLSTGYTPHWHCWEDNLPSRALAERIGFTDPVTYSVYHFAI